MEILLQQTFTILTSSPGNLIYHLILAFAVMAAMQAIAVSAPGSLLGARRKRMLLGLGLVLGAQLLLFLASGLAWQGIISSRALLPPLDRAVILWSLGWTAWLWAFPEPERRVDMLMGVFSLATVILFLFAFSLWSRLEASMAFNQTDLNLGWVALAVLIILVAVLFLLVRRPEGWGTGLTFLGIHLAGFTIHLVGTAPTEYFAPAVRLAQLCSFPLLFALAQRLTPRHEQGAPWQRSPTQEASPADLDILATWLQLASYDKPEKMVRDLPRALAHTLQVDLCYLVSPPLKREEISISGGYDRTHSTEMPGFILKQSEIPALAEAIHKGQTLRLTQADAGTADLSAIAATAGLERSGNLLFIPLLSEKQSWGGILLLSPHSGDTWSAADPATLQPLLDSLVPMLQRSGQKAVHKLDGKSLQQDFGRLEQRFKQLTDEKQKLLQEVERLRALESQALPPAPGLPEDVLASIQQLQAPLASIQEHAGLLSSESLGVLRSPQRKTLEQITASTERAISLLETLLYNLQNNPGDASAAKIRKGKDREVR